MKLYAGHQYEKFEAPIDNTYTASAHSAVTIISWYNENEEVGIIAIVSQVLFPIFVTFFVTIFFIFIVELEPYECGKKLQNELDSKDDKVKANAEAGLLTKYIAATLFHLFTLGNDGAALGYYGHIPKAIREYYCSEPHFWAEPITMLVLDLVSLVLFILIPPIAIVLCCKEERYRLIYSLVSPFSCIATHSYHIVFAFIIDPYHATSILLIYAIIAFINIQAFQKLFYLINKLISGDICRCCRIKNTRTCIRYFIFMLIFIIEFVFMGTSIGLSITLIVKLPLSNAIDDAPNHLYVIYQASITFFAALIAFQVIFRHTDSTFDVFVKAIDGYAARSTSNQRNGRENQVDKTWMELSETEKEMLLAKIVTSYYLNQGVQFVSQDEIQHVLQQSNSSTAHNQSNECGCWDQCPLQCRKGNQYQAISSQPT